MSRLLQRVVRFCPHRFTHSKLRNILRHALSAIAQSVFAAHSSLCCIGMMQERAVPRVNRPDGPSNSAMSRRLRTAAGLGLLERIERRLTVPAGPGLF